MGTLDPLSIEDLALALSDGEPRDIRMVPGGWVEHLKVTALVVRRDGEGVELTDVNGMVFERDAEELWQIRSSVFSPDIAEPAPESVVGYEAPSDEYAKAQLLKRCVRAACMLGGFKEKELKYAHGCDYRLTMDRYVVMQAMWEMSNLHQATIPPLIGYASPQPLFSARSDFQYDAKARERLETFVKLVRTAERKPWRRSEPRHHCFVD